MRDRQVRASGINVNRGNVYFYLGSNLLQIEPADAPSRESESSLELHRNPFRIFANFDSEALGLDFNSGLIAHYVGAKFEIGTQLAASGSKWIFWAWYVGMETGSVALDRNTHATLAKFVATSASGTETERTLASL